MSRSWRLIPPPRDGPWLLCVDGRNYAVDARLGRRLAELGDGAPDMQGLRRLTRNETEAMALQALLDGRKGLQQPGRGGRCVRRRLMLLPASVVEPVSAALVSWTSTPALVGLTVAGILTAAVSRRLAPVSGAEPTSAFEHVTAAVAIFFLTALWHEFGHGAALRRSGYPVGAIGVGLLGLLPVLFCDVSSAGLLPRAERLRIDVSGCVFQLAAGGLLLLHGRMGAIPAAETGGLAALTASVWSLLPLPGTDGRWLLMDLLDAGTPRR